MKPPLTESSVTIPQFIQVIKRLPADEPQYNPRVSYKTQKEHWLGWLRGYSGPGAYGRKNWKRDARFAYNHVVCPGLLLYLIRAIPLRAELMQAAEEASQRGATLMEKAGAIRKVVPWSEVYQAIWGKEERTLLEWLGIHSRKPDEEAR